MPIDRGNLDQQLQSLGESSSWWDRRELRDLPAVLHADEEIRAITRGKLGRFRTVRRMWLIVVTDRRLLCLRSGGMSWRQFELNASQIVGVTMRVGVFRGRVVVTTSDRKYRLQVPGADAYKLGAVLSAVANCGQDTLSGPAHMVRRVVSHVLALPAAAFNPPPPARALPPASAAADEKDQHFLQLEEHIEELQQQVKFLEQLVRQRQTAIAEQELQSIGESFTR